MFHFERVETFWPIGGPTCEGKPIYEVTGFHGNWFTVRAIGYTSVPPQTYGPFKYKQDAFAAVTADWEKYRHLLLVMVHLNNPTDQRQEGEADGE